MEINVKEARRRLSFLLDQVEEGNEIVILRRGKKVARLVPLREEKKRLPRLADFRATIKVSGKPLSGVISEERAKERY